MDSHLRWQLAVAIVGFVFLALFPYSPNALQDNLDKGIVPSQSPIFREGVIEKPQYINPLLANANSVDQDIAAFVFEGLVTRTGAGQFGPDLAQNWTVSDDGLVYRFHLDPQTVWSDGTVFSSDDVVFTIGLIQSEAFPGNRTWHQVWQAITVTKIDALTVQITLPEPFPQFLNYATLGLLPKHILANSPVEDLATHPFNLAPIGTGPYVVSTVTDQFTRLSANPLYRTPSDQIRTIELYYFSNPEALHQAFDNDQIDAFRLPYLGKNDRVIEGQIFSVPLQRYTLIYINQRDSEKRIFFQDREIRQALLQLLDRRALVDTVYDGQLSLVDGPLLPTNWAFKPKQLSLAYDFSAAIQSLEEEGWAYDANRNIRLRDNVPFTFGLLVSEELEKVSAAEKIAEQWRKAGIEVSVERTPQLKSRLSAGDFDAALVEVQLTDDPDLYALWHQSQIDDNGQNYSGWAHTEASEMLRKGRLALTPEQRLPYYYAFQDIFTDEVPAILLYQSMLTYVVRDTIKDIQLSELSVLSDRFDQIHNWSVLIPE